MNGQESVKRLISLILPSLVVMKPLAEKLLKFPAAPRRNRYTELDDSYLDAMCNVVDFTREFNKGKNREHKWNGESIRSYVGS